MKSAMNNPEYGFDGHTCKILIRLDSQSDDIALGVNNSYESKTDNDSITSTGAGDQGMMFGYATSETPDYMPYPVYIAHKLTKKLSEVRKNGTLSYLRPDGKSQVTVEYDENDNPVHIDTIVISTQHDEKVSQKTIHKDIKLM